MVKMMQDKKRKKNKRNRCCVRTARL